MNGDTSKSIRLDRVEQGMNTLTHDWRNILNGVNLRINSAKLEDDAASRENDLDEALRLIADGTTKLTEISRKLAEPNVTAIAYPADFFLEDLATDLAKNHPESKSRIQWENENLAGKAMLDFNAVVRAIRELLDNTLRYLPEASTLPVASRIEDGFFVLSWSEQRRPASNCEVWGSSPFMTTERGHLGLGIYYAKRVFAALQGSLDFHFSDATNSLETRLTLPLQAI